MDVEEIKEAIKSEIEATPSYYDFRIIRSLRERELWKVLVDPSSVYSEKGRTNVVLDDSFEDADVWWGGPPKGSGKILSVLHDSGEIVIRNAQVQPPDNDGLIRLYPPSYLDKLLTVWGDHFWSTRSLKAYDDISQTIRTSTNRLPTSSFPFLRDRQRESFNLVGYQDSFLWGPPGTGKTTTLGALLVEYLLTYPKSKILLLSTTNNAVDQATVSVDNAIRDRGQKDLRECVFRIGQHFLSSNYIGREHLLPVIDKSLVAKLHRVEASRPDPNQIHEYNEWKKQVESLRQLLKAQNGLILDNSRLASMTITRAIWDIDLLKERKQYDLVVFDEASQVGLAHALALIPLGKSRLYAGDPKQLPPIVRNDDDYRVKHYLGRSPFDKMPSRETNTCMLNEQSRMAKPICNIVSQVFYNGDLIVARKSAEDPKWEKERRIRFGEKNDESHVEVIDIQGENEWLPQYNGPIRYESARLIVKMIKKGLESGSINEDKVIILTPFRAQRVILKGELSKAGIKRIKVSTVHRAQGSESPIVIFDPVKGASDFLKGDDAEKLINVAISRAQGKLILLFSDTDKRNKIFSSIMDVISIPELKEAPKPIATYSQRKDFPNCILGKVVQINSIVLKALRIIDGGKILIMLNMNNGKEMKYKVNILKNFSDTETHN